MQIGGVEDRRPRFTLLFYIPSPLSTAGISDIVTQHAAPDALSLWQKTWKTSMRQNIFIVPGHLLYTFYRCHSLRFCSRYVWNDILIRPEYDIILERLNKAYHKWEESLQKERRRAPCYVITGQVGIGVSPV
jgi:hypothetical protein